jgi:hypothetical protein
MSESISWRRICLFGGPGAGKSTTAHWLMWRLKSIGQNAEMSREWIKRWAYARRPVDRITDQVIVMGRQIEEELEAIATGCIVVTDSPVLLQAAYAEHQQDIERAVMIERHFQAKFPTCNIFMQRGRRQFNQAGRWENAGVAGAKDVEALCLLTDHKFPYFVCDTDDHDTLWKIITGQVPATFGAKQ